MKVKADELEETRREQEEAREAAKVKPEPEIQVDLSTVLYTKGFFVDLSRSQDGG
jgi:hypothetical protein